MKAKSIGFSDLVIIFVVAFIGLLFLIPMQLVLSTSFSSESALMKDGFSLVPRQFSLDAHKMVYRDNITLLRSYMISLLMLFIGTPLAVITTACAAFMLANDSIKLKYRNRFALFFFIPMVLQAGLVPWYMMCTALGLRDNVFALIVPSLIFNAFNLFLVRNYFSKLPSSLHDSAKIDGANDLIIAFRIYFPISLPVLAVITLFYGLGYWNDWFNAIMLVDNRKLYPLQYLLFRLQSEVRMMREMQTINPAAALTYELPSNSLKMAVVIATIGPIIILFPFLQRFFIKGLIIGSVKG